MIKLHESLVDTYVIGIHNQVIIHEGQRECVHKHCCIFAVEQQCTPSPQTLGKEKDRKGGQMNMERSVHSIKKKMKPFLHFPVDNTTA